MKRKIATCIAISGLLVISLALPASSSSPPAPGTSAQVAALVAASVKIEKLTTAQRSALASAGNQSAELVYNIPASCSKPTQCVYGDTTASKTVVLFGDSHAVMWFPALLPVALADHFKIVIITRYGCPLAAYSINIIAGCPAFVKTSISTIDAMKPALVIVSDRTTYFTNISTAKWKTATENALKALKPSGAAIAMIGDIRDFVPPIISCLAQHVTHVQSCSTSNVHFAIDGHWTAESEAAAGVGALYVNPLPWLCTAKTCSPVIGSYIAYWDKVHVSAQYAYYLSAVMATALKVPLAKL